MTKKRKPTSGYKLAKQANPLKVVRGRKALGGRTVTLKNFTGTVTRTNAGHQLIVLGRSKKK